MCPLFVNNPPPVAAPAAVTCGTCEEGSVFEAVAGTCLFDSGSARLFEDVVFVDLRALSSNLELF